MPGGVRPIVISRCPVSLFMRQDWLLPRENSIAKKGAGSNDYFANYPLKNRLFPAAKRVITTESQPQESLTKFGMGHCWAAGISWPVLSDAGYSITTRMQGISYVV